MFKKALDITWLYLKMTYSSRSVLIFQLLLPILFTFMVGQGTGGFDGPSSTVVTWPLAVANEDSGSLGASLVDTLSADPNLDVTIIAADEAETAVTNDDALAALIIPADFSEQLAAGQHERQQDERGDGIEAEGHLAGAALQPAHRRGHRDARGFALWPPDRCS